MWRRVANVVAQAELMYPSEANEEPEMVMARAEDSFFEIMATRKFVPGSPILSNAGKPGMCYSSCFVLPIDDSLPDIMETAKNTAIVHKAGGGTGFSFSRLRPKGAHVATTKQGVASGPVGFMRMYDAITEEVKQGGTRRGANMGILNVHHPDIIEFINCKRAGGITNFNISVGITDQFMEELRETPHSHWITTDPHTGVEQSCGLTVREVWQAILDAAWATGDPGMVFLDRINHSSANPIPSKWTIEATNPCGEQPLAPYDVCNLGSINLGRFVCVTSYDGQNVQKGIAWDQLFKTVYVAVRFLDDVIDVNSYPLPQIEETAKGARRIGMGVMGWADMLMQLEIPYASEEAIRLAARVMQGINEAAANASRMLARQRGPFPWWDQSIYKDQEPIRNSTRTTIAPTGTIGIIADASSGIEPIFEMEYTHDNKQGRIMTVRNWVYDKWIQENPGKTPPADVFVTAHQIEYKWHVAHQSAFQSGTDNAVSKTINLPSDATVEDVEAAYMAAWATDCLGITVFRDGCKGEQVLNHKTETPEVVEDAATEAELFSDAAEVRMILAEAIGETSEASPRFRDVPTMVYGRTMRVNSPEGTINVTINSDDDGPIEIFLNVGRAGSDVAALAEAIGRISSKFLQLPGPMSPRTRLTHLATQLRGLGGTRVVGFGAEQVRSVPDAVARVLERYIAFTDIEAVVDNSLIKQVDVRLQEVGAKASSGGGFTSGGDLCPQCGGFSLARTEGCKSCHRCGYSEC